MEPTQSSDAIHATNPTDGMDLQEEEKNLL